MKTKWNEKRRRIVFVCSLCWTLHVYAYVHVLVHMYYSHTHYHCRQNMKKRTMSSLLHMITFMVVMIMMTTMTMMIMTMHKRIPIVYYISYSNISFSLHKIYLSLTQNFCWMKSTSIQINTKQIFIFLFYALKINVNYNLKRNACCVVCKNARQMWKCLVKTGFFRMRH